MSIAWSCVAALGVAFSTPQSASAPQSASVPSARVPSARAVSPAPTASPPASAATSALACPIESIGLFKNGLAVVGRSVVLPGPGTFDVAALPEAVHGTLWLTSAMAVEARVEQQTFEQPVTLGNDLASELGGQQVTLRLRGADHALTGRVVAPLADSARRTWDRGFEPTHDWGWWRAPTASVVTPAAPRYLVLESDGGLVYVDPATIESVAATGARRTVARTRPVLRLVVRDVPAGGARVHVHYLAKGIAWAPAYLAELGDDGRLTLRQQALIKNELEDLAEVPVELISGFPSIEFAAVASPLSLSQTWAQFFHQVGQAAGARSGMAQVFTQSVVSNAIASDRGVGAAPDADAGDGVDLHYQSLGRRSLREGDALLADVGSGVTRHARIVEWIVPDTRDEFGNPVQEHVLRRDPERWDDAPWDAIRFDNPFAFPMTTAPLSIVQGGHFLAQRKSTWVNPGEETTVRITKALSVRTQSGESEEPGKRELLRIASRNYRKAIVKGELVIHNHRGEAVELVVRRRFSGQLVEADGEPTTELREEGVYSVNPRHELVWRITIAAGEPRVLGYRYALLVPD